MPSGDGMEDHDKNKMDVFDGTNPASYRMWKRRAQLMLASLPSTISEKKYGPKLMCYISGEAEALLESLSVEKICKEGGDQEIWKLLDAKYGPQPLDLMQTALRTFFHELQVKPGEHYRQFVVRFEAARRKLEEQEVKLPSVVLGFFFLKKLRLEAAGEAMIMTATAGKLDYEPVEKAVRAIFPEGKGSAGRNPKDAFAAESEDREVVEAEEDEEQKALELLAEDIQGKEDYDEEEVLDAFESYVDVRRRMQEQRKNRGYFPAKAGGQVRWKAGPESWKLTGTVSGRVEALKSRTRCHHCKQFGHWKKECPMKRSSASSTAASSEGKGKEVLFIESMDEETRRLWDVFVTEDSKVTKNVTWSNRQENDVQNSGSADTHSTGNRQRLGATEQPSVVRSMDERRFEQKVIRDAFPEEVLSSEAFAVDSCLSYCGVPDTACRKTLVGAGVLARIEGVLERQGMTVKRARIPNDFRFGNAGVLRSSEVVMLPANVAGARVVIKAAVLPDEGQETPLLLSKEILRQLGAVMNLGSDEVWFESLGKKIKMRETNRAHYAIPLFVFDADAECLVAEGKKRDTNKVYCIDQLEQNMDNSNIGSKEGEEQHHLHPCDGIPTGISQESHDEQSGIQQQCGNSITRHSSVDAGDADGRSDHRQGGQTSRCCGGSGGALCGRIGDHESGKVQEHPRLAISSNLCGGQGVHQVGALAHQSEELNGHEAVEGVCRSGGCKEGRASPNRVDESTTSASAWTSRSSEECGHANESRISKECSHDIDTNKDDARCSGNKGSRVDSGRIRDGMGANPSGIQPDGSGREMGQHGSGCPRHERVQEEQAYAEGHAKSLHDEPHDAEHGERVMSRKTRKGLLRNVQYLEACDAMCSNDCREEHGYPEVFHVDLSFTGVDVDEVFSVPRICPVASMRGLSGGKSYDIQGGWNFLLSEHRSKCLQEIRQKEPEHVHVSPPCGPYSQMQRLNKKYQETEHAKRKRIEGEVLLRFAMQICEEQLKNHRKFSFEHPAGADSWVETCVEELSKREGVQGVVFDQCVFGLRDPVNQMAYRKRTRILTNSSNMVRLFEGKFCDGTHDHQPLEGKTRVGGKLCNRTECAQVYPRKMIEMIVKAIRLDRNDRHKEVLAVEPLQGKHEQIQESVMRCHVNLGHPSRERFLHLLKSAGANEKAIEIAKNLKCSTCVAKKPPLSHPVNKTKRAEGFNQQVSMDTFELQVLGGKKIKILNILCEGTGLQVCIPLWKGPKAKEVRKAYRKYWLRWAGNPIRVLTDGGTEFDGEMQEGLDRDGTYTEKTSANSPWQNGRCERHGGIWKDIYHKAHEECLPKNKNEVNELVDKVTQSKNSMTRKHGYSPYQHVFGCDLRIPQGLLDDVGNTHYQSGILHGVEEFQRAQEIRQAARRALVALDDQDKVRRAIEHQSRPPRGPFEVGDFVFYWRPDREHKRGIWRGPARVIGFFESKSRVWVSHGNKVLRCSPEQLKKLTDEQEAAIKFTTPDLLTTPSNKAKRGAHVFTDISGAGIPPDDAGEGPMKRRRMDEDEVDGEEMTSENVRDGEDAGRPENTAGNGTSDSFPEPEGTDEATTQMGDVPDSTGEADIEIPEGIRQGEGQSNVGEMTQRGNDSYGPIRRQGLAAALRHSVDILDHGLTRLPRTPLRQNENNETHDQVFEVFMSQLGSNNEIHDKDLTKLEKEQLDQGKLKEWSKLLNTQSIRIHVGKEAEKLRQEYPRERFLESRCVKTRRPNPEIPGGMELKCRWCIKGFKDPDLFSLERQSPTLSMDSLAVCLQVLVSKKWELIISDVEGAFLQGEPLKRENGKIFVKIPKDGIPGQNGDDVVEVLKCVYGLVDAPRIWWQSFSRTLVGLGMKQSELDPCTFFWYTNGELGGLICLHVDDMVIGGNTEFHEVVLQSLRNRYPFKHWKKGSGMFLGKRLRQEVDFSIICDQEEYGNKVSTIPISKERRKSKDSAVTEQERKRLRGVIGAANWLMGNTRPDISVLNAFLQQRIQRATVSDLIEANKLVAKIRDFSHVKIKIKPIPLHQCAFLVASDASWANADDLRSQAGYMVLFTHVDMIQGKKCDVSPLRWKSYKQERHTQSTLGAELMGLARALSETEWLRSILAEALHEEYTLEKDKTLREKVPVVAVIDNKPIYDHTCGDGIVIKDKRMAIDMLTVRRDIRQNNIDIRWVDTKQMIVDSLTKTNASADYLLFVLRDGKYSVCVDFPEMH